MQFEVWDQATAGTMIYFEAHSVDTGSDSTITNDTGQPNVLLGRCTPQPCVGGLDPSKFPAGSSRYFDATQGGVSVLSARVPLYATPFAIAPGPQGPAGPTGPQGPQGPAGVVQTVTAGDTSVMVSGTAQDRAVTVAANGITNAHINNGALSPAKIAGMAATLGSNIFSGTQVINTSAASGVTAESTAFNGAGVIGDGNNGSRAAGVWGRTTVGLGVVGTATTGSGTGVWGEFRGPGNSGIGVLGTTQQGGSGVRGETDFGFGVYGLSPGGVGVHGESGNIAVRGSSESGYAMYAAGDTGQSIDKGGWVKAMVLMRPDGTIELCYNSTLTGIGASTPPCGFTATHPSVGEYLINFGFRINTRFLSATNASFFGSGVTCDANKPTPTSARPIDLQTIRTLTSPPPSDCAFYLVVF